MGQAEEIRLTCKGEFRRSPITNKYEPFYPTWKRILFRLLVTFPLLLINIILVSYLILIILRFQSWIDFNLKSGRLPRTNRLKNVWHRSFSFYLDLMSLTQLFPKILLALVTTVFTDVYKGICRWLTERGKMNKTKIHWTSIHFCSQLTVRRRNFLHVELFSVAEKNFYSLNVPKYSTKIFPSERKDVKHGYRGSHFFKTFCRFCSIVTQRNESLFKGRNDVVVALSQQFSVAKILIILNLWWTLWFPNALIGCREWFICHSIREHIKQYHETVFLIDFSYYNLR